MTNLVLVVTNKLLITAAYKHVALAVMLTNCNLFVTEVGLPPDRPLTETNIILSRCNVNPPRLMGFGGSIVTEKYFFGFGHDHLANFWQWEFRSASSGEGIKEQHERWSKMTSQIGTNEAHQLALNWLTAIGVDTVMMEKKYPSKVRQKFFYQNAGSHLQPVDKSITLLPIFEVSWGAIALPGRPEYSHPAATMTVFAPTKELIEYHLLDDSLMLRPKLTVKAAEKLLTIQDALFYKFDEMQRSNLIKEFVP